MNIATGGILRVGANGGFLTAAGAGAINFSGGTLTAGGAANTPGTINLIGGNGAFTMGSAIADNGTGAVTVVTDQFNNQTLVFNTAGAYSGGTYLNEGRFLLNNAAALGTGPVNVASSAQAYLNFGGNTMANAFNIIGASAGNNDTNSAIRFQGGQTLSGTITMLGDSQIAIRGSTAVGSLGGAAGGVITNTSANPSVLTAGDAASTAFAGSIPNGTNGGSTAGLTKQGTGTLDLTGANNYTGATNVTAGSLQVGAGGSINAASPTTLSGTASLILGDGNGFVSQTFNSLTTTASTPVIGGFGAFSTLTLNNANTTTLANVFGGAVPNQNNLNLIIAGTGTTPTAILTGASTYTGFTTVTSGATLNLLGGSLGATAVTVNGGGALTGAGNNSTTGLIGGTVTAAGGSAIALTSATANTALRVTGGITLGSAAGPYAAGNYTTLTFTLASGNVVEALNTPGTLTLNAGGAFVNVTNPTLNGTITLANYGSLVGGSGFSLNPNVAGVLTRNVGRNTETLTVNATALVLSISGTPTPNVAYFNNVLGSGVFNDLSDPNSVNFSKDKAGNADAGNVPGTNTNVFLSADTVASNTGASDTGGAITNASATNSTATLTFNGGGTVAQTLTDSNATTAGASKLALTLTAGTLTVGGANAYTGGTTVTGGTLVSNNNTAAFGANVAATTVAIGTAGTVQLNINANGDYNDTFTGGGRLRFNFTGGGTDTRTFNYSNFTGTIELAALNGANANKMQIVGNVLTALQSATLQIDNNAQYITGAGTVNFGNITVIGTGNNENRGVIRLNAGTLGGNVSLLGNATIGNEGGTLTGNISPGVTGASTLTMGTGNSTGNATLTGPLSDGLGQLALTTAFGTTLLTGASTYAGATTINAGSTLQLGNGATGNDGTISGMSGITNNGTLVYNRFGSATSSRVISGTGAVTKMGPGSQALTGDSTYSGGTTISGGALLVNNVTGSATGTGAVAVNATALLGGGNGATTGGTLPGAFAGGATSQTFPSGLLGVVAGAVTVAANGTLAPGNSLGTLTLGSLTMSAGSLATYEFNGTANDLTVVNGTLTLAGGNFTLLQEGTQNAFATTGFYNLFRYAGGTFTGSTGNLMVVNMQSGVTYDFVDDAADGLIQLRITAVPEPGTWALLLAGLLGALGYSRRRRTLVAR